MVKWSAGGQANVYRVGHNGKVMSLLIFIFTTVCMILY